MRTYAALVKLSEETIVSVEELIDAVYMELRQEIERLQAEVAELKRREA